MPRARSERIATLTMNPALDISFAVERMTPTRKLRCQGVRADAGGGGINVARAIRRLGGRSRAILLAGGGAGERIQAMLRSERVAHLAIPIAGETREDFTAQELATGAQYRFVLPGPKLRRADCAAALEAIAAMQPRPAILVASGSLPPGAPLGFYAELARLAHRLGIRLALDASGAPLRRALAAGVWLVKPNLGELQALVGRPLPDLESRLAACEALVRSRKAELVALSLGAEGALLVGRDVAWRAAAPRVTALSTVGAGDSFMAGLVFALASGASADEALRQAVAAGAAALTAPGTQLCHRRDVEALAQRVRPEPLALGPSLSATRQRPRAA